MTYNKTIETNLIEANSEMNTASKKKVVFNTKVMLNGDKSIDESTYFDGYYQNKKFEEIKKKINRNKNKFESEVGEFDYLKKLDENTQASKVIRKPTPPPVPLHNSEQSKQQRNYPKPNTNTTNNTRSFFGIDFDAYDDYSPSI